MFYKGSYQDNIHVLLECHNAIHVWCYVNFWDKINRTLRQNYNMVVVVFSLFAQT